MDINYFNTNINNPSVLIPAINAECKSLYEWKAYKEYDPKHHKVHDLTHRPNKLINKPTGETNESTGEPVTQSSYEKVNRISIPLQQLIVLRGAAFLTGGQVKLKAKTENATQEKLLSSINTTWGKNKLQFKNNIIAKKMMSETEVCEIWYSKVNKDKTVEMRCQVYSPSMGYGLLPVFSNTRDLIAFGLQYEDAKVEKKRYFDLYTEDKLIKHEQTGSGWVVTDTIPLIYGKIPVIYYSQERSAWEIVQPMIDRLETIFSNFGDTNDYNGSPILFARGTIKGFSSKGESGKLIESDGDNAELKYVTWEGAPEAIKLEIETLLDFIYTCTQTPNISFKEMKGLGGISGVAYDRIMIDAHLKAKDQQDGMFGECIQRRINFLKSACAAIESGLDSALDLEITPQFSLFSIDDIADKITTAMKANGNKPVMSQRESIEFAGVSDDAEATLAEIEAETPIPTPVKM